MLQAGADKDVFVVTVAPEREWHHSRFPTPFVTVDYDRNGDVIQVVGVGPAAARWLKWLEAEMGVM